MVILRKKEVRGVRPSHATFSNKKESLSEVPRRDKRIIPKSLEYYERKYNDQKKQFVLPTYLAVIL